jgi:L-ascorbate metabolism protein UlaG (beta-lactamase superfamily)
MIITYYGASCFKVQSGDIILAFDPPSKKSGFKTPRFQASIVFVSADHKDHNGFDNIAATAARGAPFLINGPGEYEIGGVTVCGLASSPSNTIYVVKLETLSLCHLGRFGGEIRSEAQELLGDIDVLFAPARNHKTTKIINQIEPKLVIPAYEDNKQLKGFLKEAGQAKTHSLDKLTFKKKDIADKKEEIVVLKPLIIIKNHEDELF